MKNRYPGKCACGGHVAKDAGRCFKAGRRWSVICARCDNVPSQSSGMPSHRPENGSAYLGGPGTGQRTYYNPSGESFVNQGGRCEDAPCCGCCS